jgi:hypothetical protein
MADRAYLEQLTKRLADDGRLIEAGWVALRLAIIPENATGNQLDSMRFAYMAGAQHLFSSILAMLEPGADEVPAEVKRMDLINKELEAFTKEMELRVAKPKGQA